jgi:hypothetical protein
VKKIVALLFSFVLLQCEWHDSFAQIFNGGSCCSTECCAKQCGDDEQSSKDNSGKANDLMKNCCTYCCYLPPASTEINVFATRTEIIFSENLLFNISFVTDCFHPPEPA